MQPVRRVPGISKSHLSRVPEFSLLAACFHLVENIIRERNTRFKDTEMGGACMGKGEVNTGFGGQT
jgi:hypothetical protein